MANQAAFDFESDRTRAEIRRILQAWRPWLWSERDKEAFGDYLVTYQPGFKIRIYDIDGYYSDGPTWTLDTQHSSDETLTWSQLQAEIRELLAVIDARNVAAAEYFD